MNVVALLMGAAGLTIFGGIGVTRKIHRDNQKRLVASRVSSLTGSAPQVPVSLLREQSARFHVNARSLQTLNTRLKQLIGQAGATTTVENLLTLSGCLFLLPLAVVVLFQLPVIAGVLLGTVLSLLPFGVLFYKKSVLRRKFIEQLPDAIDLMISVLRSGHSIPQCVKAVGQEVPAPCGPEFLEVLHRMNLGLQLADALAYSCSKYSSHELDLIRRAFAIHSEVGGSLAELLDKTNITLRQRLKLVKQVGVLTAQSRLTMIVVGLLPIVMAVALSIMNPRYLTPLTESDMGKTFILAGVLLELVGLAIMKKLATVKV